VDIPSFLGVRGETLCSNIGNKRQQNKSNVNAAVQPSAPSHLSMDPFPACWNSFPTGGHRHRDGVQSGVWERTGVAGWEEGEPE
jgi:hypothetical protein